MEIDLKDAKATAYYRKSSVDDKSKQIQSIPDQRKEVTQFARQKEIKIVTEFQESRSAKNPGRPEFNKMIQMIRDGEINAILCWDMTRLSRNPQDGGVLQQLLLEGKLKYILTPTKIYLPTDNVILMGVDVGVATQYSIDVARGVRRGMKTKVEKGSPPWRAPIGYLPDKFTEKGKKKILVDDLRFPLVRQMWDIMLTGNYTMKQVIEKANDELGLRTRETKKNPSHKISLSSGYKIFTHEFYTGQFYCKGELKQGDYPPMITKTEFDIVQRIMGEAGKPRPKYKRLPFTGTIACGECGRMFTADQKFQFIKAENKNKEHIYYRCTRGKESGTCHQKSIKYEALVEQVQAYLDTITIPPEFLNWALEVLRKNNEVEESNRSLMLMSQRKNYDKCLQRAQNLVELYISPENLQKELLSAEEFKAQKNLLMSEKSKAESQMRQIDENVNGWLELTEKTFNFATYAKKWFDEGDYQRKTEILRALGKHFTLLDGKLSIDLQEPFLVLTNGLKEEPLKTAKLESTNLASSKTQNPLSGGVNLRWSG